MAEAPYMPLYVGDYLGDTQHLTTEQHGAYLLLLMTMWRTGGRLPDDAGKLARIARVTPRRWPLVWEVVGEFFTVADGAVTQGRLERERQKAASISQKRSNIGKLGGRPKSLNNKEHDKAKGFDLLKQNETIHTKPYQDRKKEGAIAPSKEADPAGLGGDLFGDEASPPAQPQCSTTTTEETRAGANLPAVVGGSGAPRAARRKAGHALPPDWQPSDADWAYAAQKGLQAPQIEHQAEKFRNYWHGNQSPKVDWAATWRNWILTAIERGVNRGGGVPAAPRVSATDSAIAGIMKGYHALKERERNEQ
ncbi:DUF1376 domain-containing protein [Rhodopseudomonas sp. B29]|uniref:YdaU family protein n=1 Tax=Rhodopseudomonas sp. B29 TaxID=95607 RepID=UPI0003B60E7E|nr:DUF1376 domain-containing protein [Rhodopseudomonas sp. B29]